MKRYVAILISVVMLLSSMVFLQVSAENTWASVDGYNSAASGHITEADSIVTFEGYGVGKYVGSIEVKEGDEISFQINPKVLSSTRQYFAVAFTNKENNFFGNTTRDSADGFSVQLRGFGSYVSGAGVFYSEIVDGVYVHNSTLGVADANFIGNVSANMTLTSYHFTMTKKTQTIEGVDYTWEIKFYSSLNPSQTVVKRLKASEVSSDCFDSGLYITAGCRTGTYETYEISSLTVPVPGGEEPEEPGDYKGSDLSLFTPVRGLSGSIGSIVGSLEQAVFTGYGGASYSGSAATTGMAAEIALSNVPSTGHWYSVGLVNKPNVFWSGSNLAESQGLVVLVSVSGDNVIVSVKNITQTQFVSLGDLTVTGAASKHSIAIYRSGDNWIVAVDGNKSLTVPADTVALGDSQYVTAGANGNATMVMTMSGLYLDSQITDEMKVPEDPGNDYDGSDLSLFTPVRGLSGSIGSIAGSAEQAVFTGYGGASYSGPPATTGMAAEITLSNVPSTSHWYSVGLVNKPNAFWSGSNLAESQGLVTLLSVSGDTITVSVKKITATQLITLGDLTVTGAAGKHIIAIYKTDGKWIIAVDGDKYIAVDASEVALGNAQYVTAGANGTANMVMTMSGLYLDSQMKPEMFATVTGEIGNDLTKFVPVRGLSGAQGSIVATKSMAEFNGFGGSYYDAPVSTAMAVDFAINTVPTSASSWYSFGLVNKHGVFWKPDGTESLGLTTLITVADGKLSVGVRNIIAGSLVDLGTLTAENGTGKHTLAIYKSGDKWYFTLDGGQSISVASSEVSLGSANYITAGANGPVSLKMTATAVYIDSEVTDSMKNTTTVPPGNGGGVTTDPEAFSNFVIVRGYSGALGTAAVTNGVYQMNGYGGTSFLSKVATGVAADFTIQESMSTGYWFSFGLVNKQKVFWKPDGTESQGIVTLITISGDTITVTVKLLHSSGTKDIGILTAQTGGFNKKHSIAFYRQGGQWYITIDGKKGLSVDEDLVDLNDFAYLCAGASGGTALKMAVQKIYINSNIPASYKLSSSQVDNKDDVATSDGSTGDFKVIRGFSGASGGVLFKNNVLTMNGYGGISYTKGITEAVSVDFQVTQIPANPSYWYSFGLVNGKAFWKPDGTETRGLVTTFKKIDAGTQFSFNFVDSRGMTYLRSIVSKKDITEKFTLTFFLKAGMWYASIDGEQMISIPADDLYFKSFAYLCMGASSHVDMQMKILSVRTEGEVSDGMKAGTLLVYAAKTSKTRGAEYNPYTVANGTSFDYDSEFTAGSVTGGTAKSFAPATNLIKNLQEGVPMYVYFLGLLAILATIATAVSILKMQRPKSGDTKADMQE